MTHRTVVSACTLYLVFKEPDSIAPGVVQTASPTQPAPTSSLHARRAGPSLGEPSEVTLRPRTLSSPFYSAAQSFLQLLNCASPVGPEYCQNFDNLAAPHSTAD